MYLMYPLAKLLIKRCHTVLSLQDFTVSCDVFIGIFKIENPFQPIAVGVFFSLDTPPAPQAITELDSSMV